jgi:hypothetical protein
LALAERKKKNGYSSDFRKTAQRGGSVNVSECMRPKAGDRRRFDAAEVAVAAAAVFAGIGVE